MWMKKTDWYKQPNFSKLEEELNTVEVEVDQKEPKSHKVGDKKIEEIRDKISKQFDLAREGTCVFIRGAIQDGGNLAKPFFTETLFRNNTPSREDTEKFLRLVKQDYTYSLAKYFADVLSTVHEGLHKSIESGR